MAKLFIETYVGLQDGKLGALPLVKNPALRNHGIQIPTGTSTLANSIILNLDEKILRFVPRANCGFQLKGWANGSPETSATTSPVITLTQSATEYFSMPERVGSWYNIRLTVILDQS